jgi:hypothetical protein
MENNHKNYGYVFWNNTYENIWYAIPTTETLPFFNGNRKKIKGVLTASTIDQLLTTIKKQK